MKFRNAHQKRKNESQNLSLIAKVYDSVLLFQAIFRKLKLPIQEVRLSQVEYGNRSDKQKLPICEKLKVIQSVKCVQC